MVRAGACDARERRATSARDVDADAETDTHARTPRKHAQNAIAHGVLEPVVLNPNEVLDRDPDVIKGDERRPAGPDARALHLLRLDARHGPLDEEKRKALVAFAAGADQAGEVVREHACALRPRIRKRGSLRGPPGKVDGKAAAQAQAQANAIFRLCKARYYYFTIRDPLFFPVDDVEFPRGILDRSRADSLRTRKVAVRQAKRRRAVPGQVRVGGWVNVGGRAATSLPAYGSDTHRQMTFFP